MRVATRSAHHRHRWSRSIAGLAAVALALVCLGQLRLAARPHPTDDALPGRGDAGGALTRGGRTAATAGALASGASQAAHLSQHGTGAAATTDSLRGAPMVLVSFANGAFTDFITNWVLSVQRLGLPYLVGALDARMAEVSERDPCAPRYPP